MPTAGVSPRRLYSRDAMQRWWSRPHVLERGSSRCHPHTGRSSPRDTGPRVLTPSPSTKGPYPSRRRHRSHRPGPGRGGGSPAASPGSTWTIGRVRVVPPVERDGERRGPAMPPAGPGTGRRCHHGGSGAPGGAHTRGRGRGVRGALLELSRGRRGRAGRAMGGARPREQLSAAPRDPGGRAGGGIVCKYAG